MELNRKDNDLILMCECYQTENVTEIVQMLIENKIDVNWKKTIKVERPSLHAPFSTQKQLKNPCRTFSCK
jgi:hypothetical protein